jgi:hypothetical protein
MNSYVAYVSRRVLNSRYTKFGWNRLHEYTTHHSGYSTTGHGGEAKSLCKLNISTIISIVCLLCVAILIIPGFALNITQLYT